MATTDPRMRVCDEKGLTMATASSAQARSAFRAPHTVVVPVATHRKWPDPVFPGVSHHSGYIPALLYPRNGFPNDPNLRPPNIDRQVYRGIAASLLNTDCTPNAYHLKSKGEIHAAAYVRELNPADKKAWFEEHVKPLLSEPEQYEAFERQYTLLEVVYGEHDGILDGGHTDRIWSDEEYRSGIVASYENSDEPNRNHLPVEWITGISGELIAEIVGGRNTAMQVQEKTLANHQQKFDWIKELLKNEPYANKIAYRENEPPREKPVDIRDLIALVTPFNRDMYSLEGEAGKRLPVIAFSQKKTVLDAYIDDQDKRGEKTYCRLRRVFKDVLLLHDLIHLEAVERYNKVKKGKGGGFTFVDHRDSGKRGKASRPHEFPFTGERGWDRLADGALYPMLAAFSALITKNTDGDFVWRTPDGFDGVRRLWQEFAAEFMELTANKSAEVGRNPGQIGKSTNHWEFLYFGCLSYSRRCTFNGAKRLRALWW